MGEARSWTMTDRDGPAMPSDFTENRLKARMAQHVDHPLFVCLLCPDGREWVGDYDPEDLFGECPSCGSGVGIFPVHSLDHNSPTVKAAKRAVLNGTVQTLDHLDQET